MDTTTETELSIQFYVTANFAAATSDIPGTVDSMVAEANLGFANSDIPITVRVSKVLLQVVHVLKMNQIACFHKIALIL